MEGSRDLKHGERPDPESFLDLVARSQKGRLKVYLGAAAGVGKTWKMLEEAHQLRAKDVDVVVAVVETHRRAETEEKLAGLEIIPRKTYPHKGVELSEMDLDAVLARNPEIAIVDELAHTNAAGAKHEKRWQDVEALTRAGINVITAVNIQHIESLSPVIRRITGIDVRETVPDSILTRADQVVNVDVTVEALRERLREGKIYPAPQIEQALRNFFTPANLASLRELALREVARGLTRQRHDAETFKREGRARVVEKIMVGLSSNSGDGAKLLRKACRVATQLSADWYAVHIETPAESVKKIRTGDFVALLDNINLASDLGAETVWLKAPDPVKGMLDYARDNGISKIIVGRSHQPRWRRALRRDVTARIIASAPDLDVEILGDEPGEEQ
ncbi:MAG TPA: sensor histidine kinase KdpD [Candidatus Binataceae bacterium]|nr:sensor histidine kinase KdpD [Candidatus Binataceae bacterium]